MNYLQTPAPLSDADRTALALALAAPFILFFFWVSVGLPALFMYAVAAGWAYYTISQSAAWTPDQKTTLALSQAAFPVLVVLMFVVFMVIPEDVIGSGIGPGVVFWLLIMGSVVNLFVQVVTAWTSGRRNARY